MSIKKEIEYSSITVDKVSPHLYKDDRMSAQIRQIVTKITTYPPKGGSDKQDSLLSNEPKVFKDSKSRVTWIDVPLDSTKESVEKLLSNFTEGTIYQIVSFNIFDCISEGHRVIIEDPSTDLTLDILKNKYLLRDKEDKPILKHNKEMYRSLYFVKERKEDVINLDIKSSEIDTEIEQIEEKATGSETDVA